MVYLEKINLVCPSDPRFMSPPSEIQRLFSPHLLIFIKNPGPLLKRSEERGGSNYDESPQ